MTTSGGVQIVSAMARAHRAHERRLVLWNAKLHRDGRIWDCTAVDISPGGAEIRVHARLTINSWVLLTIDCVGSFPGEVRWQNEKLAGIRFLEGVIEERLRDAA